MDLVSISVTFINIMILLFVIKKLGEIEFNTSRTAGILAKTQELLLEEHMDRLLGEPDEIEQSSDDVQ